MNIVSVLLLFCAISASAGPVMKSVTRIADGELTTIEQYPFAAIVLTAQDGTTFSLRCGAFIITIKTMLTAAFCFVYEFGEISNVRIRVGSSYISSGGTIHNVADIISHPSYDVMDDTNDIAIVHVTQPFTFSDTVQQVSLAASSPAPGETVTAIGWGATTESSDQPSEQLRRVNLTVVSQDDCIDAYSDEVTDDMICTAAPDATRQNRLTCVKDTGSPQIYQGAVFGITSWGSFYCGQKDEPSVSTRVVNYASWIAENA